MESNQIVRENKTDLEYLDRPVLFCFATSATGGGLAINSE